MEDLFKNIDPAFADCLELRDAIQTLWSSSDLSVISDTVQLLLSRNELLSNCAVFDLYSYSCTTYGSELSEILAHKLPLLIQIARGILEQIWNRKHKIENAVVRDCIVASSMHIIWRAVEMEDAPLVLNSLRSEKHWRVLFPSVSAASLMRGNDNDAFDRDVAPLLIAVAKREELPSVVRRLAIEVFEESPTHGDLELLQNLLPSLSVPEAASCAQILLSAGEKYENLVFKAARQWPQCDLYPVRLVLDRLKNL